MNKGLIITGPEDSGKTMLAKWIAGVSGKENTVWVDGYEPNLIRAINSQISDHPDGALIIIDQLKYLDQIEMLLSIPTDGFFVLAKGKPAFHIPAEKLRIIITVPHRLENAEILHTQSVLRRFEIIDTATCGYVIEQEKKTTPKEKPLQDIFNQWAGYFFSDKRETIGKFVPFKEALSDFLFHHPTYGNRISSARFRQRLIDYCLGSGLVYNPEVESTATGEHIIKLWPKGIYDVRTNTWTYLADQKVATAMIIVARRASVRISKNFKSINQS